MEWRYKNHKITIDDDGIFRTDIKSKKTSGIRKFKTLQNCKNAIDETTSKYYTITSKDIECMCSKLDSREIDFLRELIKKCNEIGKLNCFEIKL